MAHVLAANPSTALQDAEPTDGDSATHARRTLPESLLRACRGALFRRKVSDSTGAALTGGQLLMRTLLVRQLLMRHVLTDDDRHVGVLLPPSVAGVVVNAAVSLCGRVSANLNYSATADIINKCIASAGIRHVLTSKRVIDKMNLQLDAEFVLLDELRDRITLADKLTALAQAYVMPISVLERQLRLDQLSLDDVLTVIFTSGSTGVPKGVMLTHRNVASNVQAIDDVVNPNADDVLLGILPFFHSFGYTVTLWGPLVLPIGATYHYTPLDARAIGKLARREKATILLATPTFLRSYAKRCAAEDFATLDVVVAGAEKLPTSLCDSFEQKFGVRPVEGYGATELSPLVSVNVPPSRSVAEANRPDCREGSVGRPVPRVIARVVDPESFEELPSGSEGMLLVSGPNVMKGYLGQQEKTAEVVREGWYVTGDIASIDEHGFITITGRLSRFSKIGGEMVPHVRVEELIQDFVGESDEEELLAVVTAVPDARKGERLVVVHKRVGYTPEQICAALSEAGLPPLWIPSTDSFMEVEDIPVLGSGKTDLKALAELAQKNFTA